VKTIALGFLAVVALGLAALLAAGALDTAETAADLRLSWGQEPESLDPSVITGILESRYAYACFEGLVTYAPDHNTPVPGAASAIRPSPDGRVYTFPIRPEARWSNGRAVAADDFAWTWRRILECRVPCEYATMLYHVRGAEAYHRQHQADVLLRTYATRDLRDRRAALRDVLRPGARAPHAAVLRALSEDPGREPDAALRDGLRAAAEGAAARPPLGWDDVGVRVLPGNTLEVTLEHAVPFILDVFAFHTLLPVPREAVEAHGDGWFKPGRIVCNGPFVVEQWRPHYAIVLRRNPLYHGAAGVRLDRVLCRILEGGPTGLNYYERDMLDVVDRTVVPQDFLGALRGRPDFHPYDAFSTYLLRCNTTRPPFSDPRVRRAVALAIDRRELTAALRGGERASVRLVPPHPGYRDVQPDGLPYDPAEARRLLAEAYPDPSACPRIEFLMRDNTKAKDLYNVLAGQLRRNLGLAIEAKAQEMQIMQDTMNTLAYDLAYQSWVADYADPTSFLDIWITGNGNNRTGWGDPEYDRWIRESLAETDRGRRFALLARCERRVVEEACAVIPLYVSVEYILCKPFVKGVVTDYNPMDRFLLRYLRVER
jgi:oligopeptide transport system substrate-binding protein